MKILFVCEGNVNRSQMAATILKNIAPSIDVLAAGTIVPPEREGKSVSQISKKESLLCMHEIGLDMDSNVIRGLKQEMVESADAVILVGPTPGGPLPKYLEHSSKLKTWDVPDPGYGDITYTEARDMILARVKQLANDLGFDKAIKA